MTDHLDRDDRVQAFRNELDDLIERYWSDIGPATWSYDDEDDVEAVHLVAWVLVTEGRAMDDDSAITYTSRYVRKHQSMLHTLGLLANQATAITNQ